MYKNILLAAGICFAVAACNTPATANNEKESAAIIQTDKDFNDFCSQNGLSASFIKYADDSAIILRQGALPLRGMDAIKAFYHKRDSIRIHSAQKEGRLTWVPDRAMAAGDVGYSFGWWKYYTKTAAGNDTVYQGDYVTVWKKQKDGTWKYVLDGGNDTPAH